MPFVSIHRICSEFETIRENILKIPENTEDMTQVIDYIGLIKTKGLAELNGKIKVNKRILSPCCFLHKCISVIFHRFQHILLPTCVDRRHTVDWSTSWMSTSSSQRIWSLIRQSFSGHRKSSMHLSLVMRWCSSFCRQEYIIVVFLRMTWFLDICVIFQVLQKAKQRGQEELLAKRERLMVRLEKLGRRIEDLPLCSELDMMQQVQSQ